MFSSPAYTGDFHRFYDEFVIEQYHACRACDAQRKCLRQMSEFVMEYSAAAELFCRYRPARDARAGLSVGIGSVVVRLFKKDQ